MLGYMRLPWMAQLFPVTLRVRSLSVRSPLAFSRGLKAMDPQVSVRRPGPVIVVSRLVRIGMPIQFGSIESTASFATRMTRPSTLSFSMMCV